MELAVERCGYFVLRAHQERRLNAGLERKALRHIEIGQYGHVDIVQLEIVLGRLVELRGLDAELVLGAFLREQHVGRNGQPFHGAVLGKSTDHQSGSHSGYLIVLFVIVGMEVCDGKTDPGPERKLFLRRHRHGNEDDEQKKEYFFHTSIWINGLIEFIMKNRRPAKTGVSKRLEQR